MKSPFLFHEGINYVCTNQKITCTYDEMHMFRVKGTINQTDWSILNTLYRYRFLNRHCIEKCLHSENEIFLKKDSLKKNLTKLVSQGIVLRFYFTWDQEKAEPTQNTPCFYALSKGAYSFFRKRNPVGTLIDNTFEGYEIPSEINILNRLAFNQFHIFFMDQYKEKIVKQFYYEKVNLKGYEFYLEGYFRMKYADNGLKFQTFDLAVLPIRRNPYWQQEFTIRLSLIYSYVRKHPEKLKEPIVLVICEDDLQAKEAFLYKECQAETRGIYTVYTSDIALVSENILKHLYFCELVNEDSKNTILTGEGTEIKKDSSDMILTSVFEDKESQRVIYDIEDTLARKARANEIVKLSIRSIEL